jgi:hypothetical protein
MAVSSGMDVYYIHSCLYLRPYTNDCSTLVGCVPTTLIVCMCESLTIINNHHINQSKYKTLHLTSPHSSYSKLIVKRIAFHFVCCDFAQGFED